MDRRLPLNPFVFGLGMCLATCSVGLVGCGGGSPESSTEPAVTGDIPESSSLNADVSPTKQLKNGMMLPDEIPLVPQEAPASSGPGSGKGMQLPDDLSPSASRQIVPMTFVSTRSKPRSPDIRFATWDQLQQFATSTGKITVVDLWSLSCTPCLKKFPKLVELQAHYPDQVLAIGVNADFDGRKKHPPTSYRDDVEHFLGNVKATFPNFILQTPNEDLYRRSGVGSLPAVLVFDRNGKLVRTFCDVGQTAGFTYPDDVTPLIEQLLN